MLREKQSFIGRKLGMSGIGECGSVFGRWMLRSQRYFDAAYLLHFVVMGVFFILFYQKFMSGNIVEVALAMAALLLLIYIIYFDLIALECFYENPNKSEFFLSTGVTRKDIIGDRGLLGEFYACVLSKKLRIPHKILYNVCVPMPNGSYQEIDAIIITNNWMYVLECKNRVGNFTGNYSAETWIQHIGDKEYEVRNIYKQNQDHIAAVECFLKSKGVVEAWGTYCYNILLTGWESGFAMEDGEYIPDDFFYGEYNHIKKRILQLDNQIDEPRKEDFMDNVYMTLLPYSLIDKNTRERMVVTRKNRAEHKKISRGIYQYYYFEDGILGITQSETYLRQDAVFTQVGIGDSQKKAIWLTMPHLKYVEGGKR